MFDTVRTRVRDEINLTVHGDDLHLERYDHPAGDPGLMPRDAVTRRVHADLPAMLVGGFSALMLQSLHPLAMTGVARHSRWREDPVDRLRRTAAFVLATTFGPTPTAERAIATVRAVHRRVRGVADDGREYAADDPELLTWVHVAETHSFLTGYQHYARRPLSPRDRDRYYAETAPIARRLGALEVPTSHAEVITYLRRVRPELRGIPAARSTVAHLRDYGQSRRERLAITVLMNAAVGLLPGWARTELGIARPAVVRHTVDRPLATLAAHTIRWACEPSAVVEVALARLAAAPAGG